MNRTVRWALLAMLLLVTAASVWTLQRLRPTPPLHGNVLEPPMEAFNFELSSAAGPVRLGDYRGKLVVLFFGYTFCPDVCPTTMLRLRDALQQLSPAERRAVQVAMITVDPKRDTPERMRTYAASFDPSFAGLSGTPGEIGLVAAKYGIYHQAQKGSDATTYLVDHTASTFVLDREGRLRLIWPHAITGEQMAEDLAQLLDE